MPSRPPDTIGTCCPMALNRSHPSRRHGSSEQTAFPAAKRFSSTHFRRSDSPSPCLANSTEADIHPKRAAVTFDVTPETMLKYYTAPEKKRTSDEVLESLQHKLLPGHFQKLTQNSHNSG